MVIGCGFPLLFIFLAPYLDIKSGTALFTFVILMFAMHVLMPMRHGNHSHGLSDEYLYRKRDKGERKDHQHNKNKI